METMDISQIQTLTNTAIEMALQYTPKIFGALFVLFIGLKVSNKAKKIARLAMEKANIDKSLIPFISGIVSTMIKVMIVIAAAGMIGIEMTSFIAILGAAGLAIGMSLSSTLQNFAGSIMILVFKPFKVGDLIQVQGYLGSVKAIDIFNTVMTTPDNQTIIIPNGKVAADSMVNLTKQRTRRIDLQIGIGYNDDIDKARSVLEAIMSADELILKNPAPKVVVGELGDNAVVLYVQPYVHPRDFLKVKFHLLETIKKTFDKENISFPYPQRDVHMHNG
jgi:small conductance mechanosensitive channel